MAGDCDEFSGVQEIRHTLKSNLATLKAKVKAIKIDSTTTGTTSSLSSNTTQHRSKLRIELPTFNGDPLEWDQFWRLFSRLLDKERDVTEDEKIYFLLQAMKSPEAEACARSAAVNSDSYDEVVRSLQQKYDRPRANYMLHYRSLMMTVKGDYNRRSMEELVKHFQQVVQGLKHCKGYTAEQLIGAQLKSVFSQRLKHEWTIASEDLSTPPAVSDILTFLEKRLSNLPEDGVKVMAPTLATHSGQLKKARVSAAKPVKESRSACNFCSGEGHRISQCAALREKSIDQRKQKVKELNLCFNCLGTGHIAAQCVSRGRCKICRRAHHSLLHEDNSSGTPENNSSGTLDDNSSGNSESARSSVIRSTKQPAKVISATALADIHSDTTCRRGRLFLDTGSQVSLITRKLAKQLKSVLSPSRLGVIGVADGVIKSQYKTTVYLHSPCYEDEEPIKIECQVVDHLPSVNKNLNLELHQAVMDELDLRPTADDFVSSEVDILLSAAHINEWKRDSKKTIGKWHCSESRDITVMEIQSSYLLTKSGWAILGPSLVEVEKGTPVHALPITVSEEEESLDQQLERLWKMSEPTDIEAPYSPEDISALKQFDQTYCRLPDGTYQVCLPRKQTTQKLGESRSMAIRRLYANERSLQRKGLLLEFDKAMKEYLQLGHAERVPSEVLNKPVEETYYIPIHLVIKDSSSTTHYRPVFDASAQTTNGVSLNDLLLAGPSLYPHLNSLIHRFRTHRVVFTGDVSKMFRGIHLHPSERDYHRFLLRGEDNKIAEYRMTRLTFGVKSSPFLATKVLLQAADDLEQQFPIAAKIIRSSFYVDDVLTGADNAQDAKELWIQLTQLCQAVGLKLRKFRSNSNELLDGIPNELKEKETTLTISADSSTYGKMLGVHWDTVEDMFYISVPVVTSDINPTKRTVASIAA